MQQVKETNHISTLSCQTPESYCFFHANFLILSTSIIHDWTQITCFFVFFLQPHPRNVKKPRRVLPVCQMMQMVVSKDPSLFLPFSPGWCLMLQHWHEVHGLDGHWLCWCQVCEHLVEHLLWWKEGNLSGELMADSSPTIGWTWVKACWFWGFKLDNLHVHSHGNLGFSQFRMGPTPVGIFCKDQSLLDVVMVVL